MNEQELREAEKSFRISIHFFKWIFIVYGNWKRRIINNCGIGFKVYDFHLFKPKESIQSLYDRTTNDIR